MQFPLNYPLTLNFKIVAMAPQLSVADANGMLVAYVKQKMFKLKEDVNVFEDAQQSRLAYNIKADRVIDFSPRFAFVNQLGQTVGSVKRQGAKSLWKATYDVYEGELLRLSIREENPWVKVLDGLLSEVPIVGMFAGYFLHPSYSVSFPNGQGVLRMKKQPAFFQGKFSIEKLAQLSPDDEQRAFLSLMMMVLLERARGLCDQIRLDARGRREGVGEVGGEGCGD
jgi:uncharacterized protein YxjI